MSTLPSLLDWRPAPTTNSETSIAAANSVAHVRREQHVRIIEALRAAGEVGLTDEMLCERTGLSANAERPRRKELQDAGWVVDTGHVDRNRSGRLATCWRLATDAERVAHRPPERKSKDERIAELEAEVAALRAELEARQ